MMISNEVEYRKKCISFIFPELKLQIILNQYINGMLKFTYSAQFFVYKYCRANSNALFL